MKLGSIDIEGFRAFLATRGATFLDPLTSNGQLLRFEIGVVRPARGAVARRRNGQITLTGIARPLYRRMIEAQATA